MLAINRANEIVRLLCVAECYSTWAIATGVATVLRFVITLTLGGAHSPPRGGGECAPPIRDHGYEVLN